MIDLLKELIKPYNLVIVLGFGSEGRSTYRLLRSHFQELTIEIADFNESIQQEIEHLNDPLVQISLGENYQDVLKKKALVFKSPGVIISYQHLHAQSKLTSQTDVFLNNYRKQVIGVSGTKGKSTTASLLHYLLQSAGKDSLLLGNIGIPAFDKIQEIKSDTWIIFELSAHQLQHIHHAPHIGVLLNIFPEHLDYFGNFEQYSQAKSNLINLQNNDDIAIFPSTLQGHFNNQKSKAILFSDFSDPDSTATLLDGNHFNINSNTYTFPRLQLMGNHNKLNILAALLASLHTGADLNQMIESLPGFSGLPHRLEFVACKKGILYYNDSISTVPQSTIAAIEALEQVGSIILGGYDRGIDYVELVGFIENSNIEFIAFLGLAGKRMMKLFSTTYTKKQKWFDSLDQALTEAKIHTPTETICLLSPAAASYDQFNNFEHRGEAFKKLVNKISS